jgi:OOP family OmpA-OmpF porin
MHDADGDGVTDSLDECAATPAGIRVDANGCPVVKPLPQKLTLNIEYASGSARPDAESRRALDEVAEAMRAYPDTRIKILGFTDNIGSSEANQELSLRRAQGIRDYLRRKGVESARMVAEGLGEHPRYFVASNQTAEGRKKNRRVEIIRID